MSRIIEDAITFDDVLLVPAYSDVLPNAVSLNTQLTQKISLKIPLVSAAMDTVTESNLAIAMAQEGGVGIIHKNMSIKAQAAEVRKVSVSSNRDPMTNMAISERQRVPLVHAGLRTNLTDGFGVLYSPVGKGWARHVCVFPSWPPAMSRLPQ